MKVGLALIAAIALMFGAAAQAQPQPQSNLKMTMDYDGVLYALNVAPVKVLVVHATGEAIPGGYATGVVMQSYGILRALKKVDINASSSGKVGPDLQPRPGVFTYIHHDGKRVRHVKVAWEANDVQVTSSPPFFDLGQPPASLRQKLDATDPLTQIVRVTNAVGPQAICHGPDRFFDGKQLYYLEFTPAQRAPITREAKALGITSAAQCNVSFTEVAGFKAKKAGESRTQGLTTPITMVFGQIGANGPWVIYNIHAGTVIGYANIMLKHVTVTGQLTPRS